MSEQGTGRRAQGPINRIGIDLRCLPADGSAGGGIAHSARAITQEIVRSWHGSVICFVPHGASIGDGIPVVWTKDPWRKSFIPVLASNPCDVMFVPSGAVSPAIRVPAIPWVHDLDIFDHPEWFPQSWWKRQTTTRLFIRGLRRAPQLFAVSSYTRAAIERFVPSAKGHITVTGEGGDEVLRSIPTERLEEEKKNAAVRIRHLGITRRFALMLGTVEPRKNIPLICRVWPEVARTVLDVDLVIAGQEGWKTEPINAAIRTCGAIRLMDFSEQDRRDLLLAADIVLVPSFSEGFGLVALEAIQAGTPVLASNRGALPEVVGTGEWVLDPEDQNAWIEAMRSALSQSSVREQWVVDQSPQRERFSWERAANEILSRL